MAAENRSLAAVAHMPIRKGTHKVLVHIRSTLMQSHSSKQPRHRASNLSTGQDVSVLSWDLSGDFCLCACGEFTGTGWIDDCYTGCQSTSHGVVNEDQVPVKGPAPSVVTT
jgi:hypothetical protein